MINMTLEKISREFRVEESILEGCDLLYADYTCESYSGECYVLFLKENKLYENHATHCSCYGLEGQWVPEEVTHDELLNRESIYGYNNQTESRRILLMLNNTIGIDGEGLYHRRSNIVRI